MPSKPLSDAPIGASPLAGRSVLVTGATGFIGWRLVERLAGSGARVAVLARGDGRFGADIRVFHADLLDPEAVRAAVRGSRPTVVFHLAAVVNLERTLEIADACIRVNLLGTVTLLRALDAAASPPAFVLASTAEVYGDGPVPYREGQAEQPPSPYAISKLAAERMVLSLHRTAAVRGVVLRIATAYGPRQPPHRLIPSVIEAYARGEAPRLADPEQSRDFVFVDDVVEGLIAAATHPNAQGETINIGDEATYTVRHIAETIGRLMGVDVPPRYGDRLSRSNEACVWSSSREKAGRLLGWTPRTGLMDGLERTIAWYQAGVRRCAPPVA